MAKTGDKTELSLIATIGNCVSVLNRWNGETPASAGGSGGWLADRSSNQEGLLPEAEQELGDQRCGGQSEPEAKRRGEWTLIVSQWSWLYTTDVLVCECETERETDVVPWSSRWLWRHSFSEQTWFWFSVLISCFEPHICSGIFFLTSLNDSNTWCVQVWLFRRLFIRCSNNVCLKFLKDKVLKKNNVCQWLAAFVTTVNSVH